MHMLSLVHATAHTLPRPSYETAGGVNAWLGSRNRDPQGSKLKAAFVQKVLC